MHDDELLVTAFESAFDTTDTNADDKPQNQGNARRLSRNEETRSDSHTALTTNARHNTIVIPIRKPRRLDPSHRVPDPTEVRSVPTVYDVPVTTRA